MTSVNRGFHRRSLSVTGTISFLFFSLSSTFPLAFFTASRSNKITRNQDSQVKEREKPLIFLLPLIFICPCRRTPEKQIINGSKINEKKRKEEREINGALFGISGPNIISPSPRSQQRAPFVYFVPSGHGLLFDHEKQARRDYRPGPQGTGMKAIPLLDNLPFCQLILRPTLVARRLSEGWS